MVQDHPWQPCISAFPVGVTAARLSLTQQDKVRFLAREPCPRRLAVRTRPPQGRDTGAHPVGGANSLAVSEVLIRRGDQLACLHRQRRDSSSLPAPLFIGPWRSLVIASAWGAEDRECESPWSDHFFWRCSSVVKSSRLLTGSARALNPPSPPFHGRRSSRSRDPHKVTQTGAAPVPPPSVFCPGVAEQQTQHAVNVPSLGTPWVQVPPPGPI